MIGPANTTRLRIVRMRRDYNRWVANQTLEDYALRFTAKSARIWSPLRVANTALGSISFLALEAIGGTLTLSFGFANVCIAVVAVSLLIFMISLPICAAAARSGLDIDLLTRGAGFGYIGSTITSLIYATFTFLFFGIEAAIFAGMLNRFLLIPPWIAYILCAIVVVPLVTHGVTFIARFQLVTQPVWLVLNLAPLVAVLVLHPGWLSGWSHFQGTEARGLDVGAIGMAASIMFVLVSQTAEQVDFIRFMPARRHARDVAWWSAVVLGGPAWILFDAFKILAGSLLMWAGLAAGYAGFDAVQPTQMYRLAYSAFLPPVPAIAATIALVAVSQVKINVTNAYAGSLAWSNFFSRLTHSHPGRVFYVFFNVAIALVLMEAGIVDTIQRGLVLYADLAAAWMGALVADLVINKPIGWSPPVIEFKRAHLPDINPVGIGAMVLGSVVGLAAYAGVLGTTPGAFGPFLSLAVAFLAAPGIAWATGGRTYLARRPRASWSKRGIITCTICEHGFEHEDMAFCPAYGGAICSLCCSLDSRCGDSCKPAATRLPVQLMAPLAAPLRLLPLRFRGLLETRLSRFVLLLLVALAGIYGLLASVGSTAPGVGRLAAVLIAAILSWLIVLSGESRRNAVEETHRQTRLLMNEIAAHSRTDAALQKARDKAEAASLAKSRYVVGISHELRSPLNAILGYAQLMEGDPRIPPERHRGVRIIRESGEHLSAIIAGLLDISRIEAGRIELYRDRIRLPELLEGLAQMLRPQAEAKGLRLTFEAHGLPAIVLADEHRLRQILINLLSNAIKFTVAGSVHLSASWRAQIAEFVVTDTGPGIQAGDLERIFEPFERAAPATIPGTGLGLTITRLLTEILGGEITVGSTPGEGSRFRVRLLLSDTADTGSVPIPKHVTGHAGALRRILVADDNAAHRALISDLLMPLGFDVVTTSDGPECLLAAVGFQPHLFLLDLSMPVMDGFQLARRLRETKAGRAPIIFISGDVQHGRPSDVGLRSDFDLKDCTLLSKPVELAALLREIGIALDLNWVQSDGTAALAGQNIEQQLVPTGQARFLSHAQVAALRVLVEGGSMRALREQMNVLERETPGLAYALQPLRRLLSSYQLEALRDALDELETSA
ncbi:response regulator [Lichenicola cladoniae]|uniref:histidine kinase n=1 Tax=Lichenicola cladoniae TaxID=1484109 RepID=A0A6M8H5J6_9PROT|nr:ATP-binding protein [Lichenicola cladoniae]NPD65226.1 response regulator [Acetobacteraceae bacterium]QKE88821.1 response regulator [Lichenicola cladoniae]